MQAKIALAKSIVTDFHSMAEAQGAEEAFNKVVRQKEVPGHILQERLPAEVRVANGIRVDKLLARIGLADSVSDAVRKIKAGAVEIDGRRIRELVLPDPAPELLIQVGKNWRKVVA